MNTSWESMLEQVKNFIHEHRDDLAEIEFVVGISRGGLIPAAIIATAIDKPLISAYIDRQDQVYFDRGEWIVGKRILLVDDIVRTGKTFQKILQLIQLSKPTSIQSYTLFCLKDASIQPTWTETVAEDRMMPWDV